MASPLYSMCFVGRAEGAVFFAKTGQNAQNPEESSLLLSLQALTLWGAWDIVGQSFPVIRRRERNRSHNKAR